MKEQYRIYASNKKDWEKTCREDFRKEGNPGFKCVENAIIEPLKAYKEDYLTLYRGGCATANVGFLLG